MKIFGNNKKSKLNFDSFPSIERKMTIKGRYVPGVINNGGSYFFINLQVFEDGLIDCWEMVDFELLKNKITKGWLSPTIPNGKQFSAHHLGSWSVKSGNWNFTKETYFNHIKNVVKDLNPELINLYNCYGSTTKKVGNVKTSKLGMPDGKPIRKKNKDDYFSTVYKGESFHAFYKIDELKFSLVNINIFADSKIEISGIENTKVVSLKELKNLISKKIITTEVPENSKISVYGLGDFIVGECHYSASIESKSDELNDIISKLNGEKTTSDLCLEIYNEYITNPTLNLQKSLKNAYEKIPKHLRTYVLGDMDVKDIPIRMIIYGDKEIESWSHYIISKKQGVELPTLKVPKPKDK